ncbi:hypothetical protein C2E23DRAFT_807399 [Lenzites betulinus]|nr:hypothetical protein C2E23DRAFT_807399 [Lenzites betulinus]
MERRGVEPSRARLLMFVFCGAGSLSLRLTLQRPNLSLLASVFGITLYTSITR